ncbi:energy-coupling factor transport system permease protein [Olsenella profusa DSM 13989]|uniref:energy-coupling factor transporter transmembrane component T family protein n=1 Tax=Olsenella profusa TaxID=138595 RepID=UPI0027847110|nr:energy-coupling factor transporter transmembrane component T [Olsenella profusa]MDP9859268.1 energy-coupling factor transport system permease protein [Olsenella profusa DSM 13989]
MDTAHLAFETTHASVAVAYFSGALLLAMFVMQPVYVALSLAGALAFALCALGVRGTLRKLRWQLPLLVLITLANPLFSASGSTALAQVGPLVVYRESLVYGACMGSVLIAVILWFEGASRVLTNDRLMGLMGRRLPVVALMVSMTAQLSARLVRRGTEARTVRRACSSSGADGRPSLQGALSLTTTLMGWAMEGSLERADAMRARAWQAAPHRTSYATERLGDRDALALLGVGALVGANVLLAAVACAQWHFYPTTPTLVVWWGYAPYAVLTLLPAALTLRERARWSHIERTGAGAPHASARAACTSAHRGACAASTAGEGGHGHAKA